MIIMKLESKVLKRLLALYENYDFQYLMIQKKSAYILTMKEYRALFLFELLRIIS